MFAEIQLRLHLFFLRWFIVSWELLTYILIIATLVWGFYAFGDWFEFGIVIGAGTLMVAFLIFLKKPMVYVISGFYRYARHKLDRFLAYRDKRGFFLYLRSFGDKNFAAVTHTLVDEENKGHTYHYFENLSQVLERALSPFGRVLYISNESTDPIADYGLVAMCNDPEWRSVFLDCASKARAIFFAPEKSPGLEEEIIRIFKDDLVNKVVGIMRRADMEGERERLWNSTVIHFVSLGIHIPDYDPRGALFMAVGDQWMILPFKEYLPEGKAIKEAFAYFLKDMPSSRYSEGVPLREILSELKINNRLVDKDKWIVNP